MRGDDKLNPGEKFRQERKNLFLQLDVQMRLKLVNKHDAFHVIFAETVTGEPVPVHPQNQV